VSELRREEIFAAGVVMPVAGPILREGAVLVRDGRIEAVGLLGEISRENPGVEVRYFPRCAIVPGAVNAHAHLGFRRGDAPEGGSFSRWLKGLIERLPEKESWTAEAAEACAREAIEAGTTYMAESSPYGECLPQLAGSGMAGRVYAEFFPHEIGSGEPEEAVEFIIRKAQELRKGLPERVESHVSVHAPYTVDPESSRLAARRTRELGYLLAIHLSESPEEVEFVRDGTGPLRDIFGQNDWGRTRLSPVAYAESVELLDHSRAPGHRRLGGGDRDPGPHGRRRGALPALERVPRVRGVAGARHACVRGAGRDGDGRVVEQPEPQPLRGDTICGQAARAERG
jgi:5-methylthioadenosine/S-adenosylhomocysteine deaminase